ncbi:hypothetical protein D9M72_471140 [compost metagenome]
MSVYRLLLTADRLRVSPSRAGLRITPCAAQTGLDGDATSGFVVPVEKHAGCLGYGQGGARVTHPVGPSSKLTGSALGALTVPVATRIANHLAISCGQFKADDIVLVMPAATTCCSN